MSSIPDYKFFSKKHNIFKNFRQYLNLLKPKTVINFQTGIYFWLYFLYKRWLFWKTNHFIIKNII